MLQITIIQNGFKAIHVCSTNEQAQKFLEHLQKVHVKRFGLQKIQSLQRQCYNKKQNCLNDDYRKRVLSEFAKKIKSELNTLPKPGYLKVEIKHIDNLL